MRTPIVWNTQYLSDVVDLQRGFDLPHHARRPGPYPVLTSGESGGFHDEGPIEGPGITIGRATNLGKPKWSETNFWPHNTTMFVKDFKGNNRRWVFHLFESLDLSGFDSGSVQPMLNRNYIAKVPVAVPPLAEQRAIAEVLGALDDKIAANSTLSVKINSYIHLQFKAALARSEKTDQKLLSFFKFDFGEAFKGNYFSDPGIGRPLIRIRDLNTFTSQVWTTESRKREILAEPGDILVGMDAEFRPTAWLGEPGVLNQRVCRATSDFAGPAFVREALKKPLSIIESYKTGTTVIHLNKRDLEEISICLPDRNEIQHFDSLTEVPYALLIKIASENQLLKRTRDALLPQLMSGKIRVRDAESIVEDVL